MSSAFAHEIYEVRRGDSLYKISKRYGVSIKTIKSANNLKSIRLKEGQRLFIPKGKNPDQGSAFERKKQETSNFVVEEYIDLPSQKILGKWKNEKERYLLVKVATSFIGAPYRLGGENVRGLDCSAFVRKIYQIFDVELPRTAREQFMIGKEVSQEELLPGDLVFFRTKKYLPYPTHVGIFIGNGRFIHSSSTNRKGVRIDSLSSEFFSKTYVGARRIMELEEEKEDLNEYSQNLSKN